MAEITLAATTGRTTGSRASGRLRASGKVPATLYGLSGDPVAVAVDWRELRHALTGEAGLNALINLEVDGHESALTIVKEMQRHPIKRNVLHVDFLRVSRDQAISVEVPVVLHGEAAAVREGGVVDQGLYFLHVAAKPADIPNEITVDITGLSIGDAIRVGDLQLPAGATTDVDPEETVVSAAMAQSAEASPAEGDEGEGEGAEGEGDAEAGGDAAEAGGDADAAPAEDS